MAEPRLTLTGKTATFGRRPRLSRRRAAAWAVTFIMVTAVIAAGAEAGAWFLPFAAGVCAGLLSAFLGLRACLLTAGAASLLGWAIPLWWQAMSGAPVGGVARTVAALAGLPPHAPVTVAATLLVAAAQALCGLWLVRALTPRRLCQFRHRRTRRPRTAALEPPPLNAALEPPPLPDCPQCEECPIPD